MNPRYDPFNWRSWPRNVQALHFATYNAMQEEGGVVLVSMGPNGRGRMERLRPTERGLDIYWEMVDAQFKLEPHELNDAIVKAHAILKERLDGQKP